MFIYTNKKSFKTFSFKCFRNIAYVDSNILFAWFETEINWIPSYPKKGYGKYSYTARVDKT